MGSVWRPVHAVREGSQVTRKDYVALASALHWSNPRKTCARTPERAWSDVIAAVSDVLAADNPRFSRARFERACILPEGTK